MNERHHQLKLFHSQSLNPTYEIKRALRLALSKSPLSRDQIVDEMNRIAAKEGIRKKVSKASLDNWTKDSDPDRLPSLPWLTIFCKVINEISPITCMLKPLDCDVINESERRLLLWAKAEIAKRKAARRAKHALSAIEDF